MIRLPLRSSGRLLRFEAREYDTVDVPETDRYCLTRRRDVVDLWAEQRPPQRCLVRHVCRQELEEIENERVDSLRLATTQ